MKLVVFDVDGTLIDSQAVIVSAMRTAFRSQGLAEPSASAIRGIIGLSLTEAVRQLAPTQPDSRIDLLEQKFKVEFLAGQAHPELAEQPYEGALDTLRRFEDAGWLLGLATGKSRKGVLAFIERYELHGRFVSFKTADDGPGKPHPHMLRSVIDEAGSTPEQTIMIGDTSYDMIMAKRAGVAAVGVTWGYHGASDLVATGALRLADRFDELDRHADDLIGAVDPTPA